jgi:ABC-type amino acid transport substrate-binding protein
MPVYDNDCCNWLDRALTGRSKIFMFSVSTNLVSLTIPPFKELYMNAESKIWRKSLVIFLLILLAASPAIADLPEIQRNGFIRHLGVPYANFVTGDGDGLDVAIIKLYAEKIGVRYQFIRESWNTVIENLSGKRVKPDGNEAVILGDAEVKGDIIGNGLTVLPWRAKVIDFSTPYIPTAIWILARADSPIRPILAGGDPQKDISASKELLRGKKVLGIANTCVDPALYELKDVEPVYLSGGGLNDLAPALVKGEYELTILDVPDCLVALLNYPGQIKVLGAITDKQEMAFGISKKSPQLLESFNNFLGELKSSGQLYNLIDRYYPNMKDFYPALFKAH